MLPDGWRHIDCQAEVTGSRCFPVMERDDVRLLEPWVTLWSDPGEFVIVPVRTSGEAAVAS